MLWGCVRKVLVGLKINGYIKCLLTVGIDFFQENQKTDKEDEEEDEGGDGEDDRDDEG